MSVGSGTRVTLDRNAIYSSAGAGISNNGEIVTFNNNAIIDPISGNTFVSTGVK